MCESHNLTCELPASVRLSAGGALVQASAAESAEVYCQVVPVTEASPDPGVAGGQEVPDLDEAENREVPDPGVVHLPTDYPARKSNHRSDAIPNDRDSAGSLVRPE